ncbi:MAG TPA: bifunctional diguanylate cyclase/phosphodiesterase [Solirubrobacteraceae bacterium]|jgi:diguanylate cyclase (GGDEF)-like protein|nr:bifunctional diguanylate cyclase/phosphodiesterase [Solirubrobacteraceae bacterium]
MHPLVEMPAGLRRARRSAAVARAGLALAGALIAVADAPVTRHHAHRPALVLSGFAIIFATALVQLVAPRADWIRVEESLAPVAGVLIVGLGPERITTWWLLWLVAVACGVLARGGRVYWVGRALLLASLALPIVREGRVTLTYACVCLAAITLLLVCGRVTQELRAMLDKARHDADHDDLTGAFNRAAFRRALDAFLARGGDGAVLLLDLDNFGAINKSAGHAAGDAVLRRVAEHLRLVAGDTGIAGRLGGDEFAVILTGPDPEQVGRRMLADVVATPAAGPSVNASAGMALFPRDGEDAESLLRAVDVALRVAKRSGISQLAVYAGDPIAGRGPGGASDALERLIGGEGLEMAVQPIVSVPEGTVHAYEALARFRLGSSSNPLHWFALADEFAVRDRLELACLRAGLNLLGDLPDGARLSVNLSGPLLLDPRTSELLRQTPHLDRLILEITENSLLEDTPGVVAEIERLIGEGLNFAVDDMGAGYSGLRQITTVRPTYLKLDRSLISGIDADPDRGALVSAMLGYVSQTGGHLIAEGVETEAELETLRALGVTLIQGYLLGRPAAPWPTADVPAAAPAISLHDAPA